MGIGFEGFDKPDVRLPLLELVDDLPARMSVESKKQVLPLVKEAFTAFFEFCDNKERVAYHAHIDAIFLDQRMPACFFDIYRQVSYSQAGTTIREFDNGGSL